MRGERLLLRIGGYLVGRASRFLPGEIRDERCREWTAELPAILRDPDTRLAANRAARMLWYAVGAVWGAAVTSRGARGRLTAVMTAVVGLLMAGYVNLVDTSIHGAVKAPGDWVPYFWFVTSSFNLAVFSRILAYRIRRAGNPMEGARDAVLTYLDLMAPGWLLSRLPRAVGADRSHLRRKTGTPSPPGPAASAEQAISMAKDTVGRFRHVYLIPGYRAAQVDKFIARIEATLAGRTRPRRAVTAADVQAVNFGIIWLGGYDVMVVEQALDHYAAGLARLAPSPDSTTGPDTDAGDTTR